MNKRCPPFLAFAHNMLHCLRCSLEANKTRRHNSTVLLSTIVFSLIILDFLFIYLFAFFLVSLGILGTILCSYCVLQAEIVTVLRNLISLRFIDGFGNNGYICQHKRPHANSSPYKCDSDFKAM